MKKILISLINLYQLTPMHSHTSCRFIPTCSEYSKKAIQRFGTLKGLLLTIKRVFRCHPFGKSGIDNVPEKKKH